MARHDERRGSVDGIRRSRATIGRAAVAAAGLVLLAACQSVEETNAKLVGKCRFAACECIGPRTGFSPLDREIGPVLWTEKGDPYCPPEFRMSLVEGDTPQYGAGRKKYGAYYEAERRKQERAKQSPSYGY